jgi:amino acid adenylation domain-containing protein
MKNIQKRLEQLSPADKRELLAELLKRKLTEQANAPLSYTQQRLWVLEQMGVGGGAYHIPVLVRLRGLLQCDIMERSLNEIVRRHEVLRTNFQSQDGEPIQRIHTGRWIPLPLVDLSQMEKKRREFTGRKFAMEIAQLRFDLIEGPLLRALLVRLGGEEYLLQVTIHHIVGDGWSIGVLIRELAALYQAFKEAQPSPLSELDIQYADFARWQREWMKGSEAKRQLEYWRRQLASLPVLQIPFDRARPAVQSYLGAVETILLPADLAELLRQLSQQGGTTLFMTLLAAFLALLGRYSGQSDIIVGTPVANRNRPEIEGLIGFFINTLVLRTDLKDDSTWHELLDRVRQVCLEAFANQDLTFERLVEELRPARDLSMNPLFQVVFALQNALRPPLELAGLRLEPLDSDIGSVRFDLECHVSETARGLMVVLVYNRDLFEAGTVQRILRHYQRLLEGIVVQPDQPIWQTELLSEDERRQILVEWNRTVRPFPRELCLHSLFERQVRKNDGALAVIGNNTALSYGEVNRRANQLARQLRALGMCPGTPVGVYLQRSIEMAPALLGILKAGGTYVPLDIQHPLARIECILSLLRSQFLVTHSKQLESALAIWAQVPSLQNVICLDEPAVSVKEGVVTAADLAKRSSENLELACDSEQWAYIIFTSGSTGTPKGVAVRHSAAINIIDWVNRIFEINSFDCVLLTASLCFDLSVYDIFGLLAAGGSIRVVGDDGLRDPECLLEMLEQEPVTFWDSAPAALQQLTPYFGWGRRSALRLAFLSGDWIPVKLPDQVRNEFPGTEVVALGGATEAAIWSNFYRVRCVDPNWASVPYGKPVQNARYYILDRWLNPCPIGVQGNLYIAGECLAEGYANEPELTAEKFIPDPFAATPSERMYRTGDLARYLHDGNIEFLGRADNQVKIRGFRIELGEIEAVLGQHPVVRNCAVVAREDAPGDKRLVAYIVCRPGEVAPSGSALRSHLQGRLPDFMLPASFVILPALPLTPNGKLDRRALPVPKCDRPEFEEGYMAPRTLIEEVLAGIWAEVLGLERVGIHDNFFELGGHSLLVTRITSRARDAFGIELPLRRLFETTTLAELAAGIEELIQGGATMRSLPLERYPRCDDLKLSFAQQRLWFLHQLEPTSPAYNVLGAVRLSGRLDQRALEQALSEIVRRHEVLRTNYGLVDGRPVQVILAHAPARLAIIDLQFLPTLQREEKARQLIREEAGRHFDLAGGPVWRAHLLRLDDREHVLLFNLHHIVSDAWSIGVLIREMGQLYNSYVRGEASALPELAIQYADYAQWQRQWLSGDELQRQLSYWRQQLAGAPKMLALPTDRPRPAVQSLAGARQHFKLGAYLNQGLRRLCRQQGVTLFMGLLGGFQILLSRYSGQTQVVVGTPIANRNRVELESLIGFFANTLVLRTDLGGNPSFIELLRRVREVTLGAYAHQDLPFEKLVDELEPERSLGRSSLFQVVFALQNTPPQSLQLPDLNVSYYEIENETAKFDLVVNMWELGSELIGSIEYNKDIFYSDTIARMLGHFEKLLTGVVDNPDTRLDELELASDEEKALLGKNSMVAEINESFSFI